MPRLASIAALSVAAALLLSGCAGSGSIAASSSTPAATPSADLADGVFPVTIRHAFGETTIIEKPDRIATVSWANHEVPLALGTVPVGMSRAGWGDDDGNGVLPWVEDKLAELGADAPVLFDETDGIPFEDVADTEPDVILASYSGLTQEEYDTLSAIAPVVAYPEIAWSTSYQDMIAMNSAAIGLAASGRALIAELDAQVKEAMTAQPALAGARVLFSYLDPADLSRIGFYTTADTRPGFLDSLGLPVPEVVAEESMANPTLFYTQVSAEQADRFADVDVFVTYGDPDGTIIATLQGDPLLSQIPAIAEGRIAVLENDTPLAASANPSPLSIPWGIDRYFAVLAGARSAR
ncbi:ABC transporter substrate-binding protein [Microbacterium sp.]|uniref:ABC transporter substrate-binding protein n=1 Tax=Microbacterium sp. TaxID=51671 RepID=UPI0025EACEDC|nr:ABC transporter substrate-binding protein [Microbacterium sp.]